MDSIYRMNPREIINGVPVFLDRNDSYVINYDLIARDHLQEMQKSGKNPFMVTEQIQQSLVDTRSVLLKLIKKGSRILDAGIGRGELLETLDEYKNFGVDVAAPYLEVAKSKGNVVALAKLEELPYVDEAFDCVVACDVLEHVFRLDQVILELTRVLKQDGYLVVRVPNEEYLDGYLTNQQVYSHSHVRGFNLSSLRLLFEKCFNLEFIEHKYTSNFFSISHQLKYEPPSKNDILHSLIDGYRKKNLSANVRESLDILHQMIKVSVEHVVDAVMILRTEAPEIYESLAPSMVMPAEVIAVFKKKNDDE